jgi:hypothetical protein
VHRHRNPPPNIVTAAAAFKAPPLPESPLEDDVSGPDEAPAAPPEAKDESSGAKDDDHDDTDKFRTAAE